VTWGEGTNLWARSVATSTLKGRKRLTTKNAWQSRGRVKENGKRKINQTPKEGYMQCHRALSSEAPEKKAGLTGEKETRRKLHNNRGTKRKMARGVVESGTPVGLAESLLNDLEVNSAQACVEWCAFNEEADRRRDGVISYPQRVLQKNGRTKKSGGGKDVGEKKKKDTTRTRTEAERSFVISAPGTGPPRTARSRKRGGRHPPRWGDDIVIRGEGRKNAKALW